METMKPVTAEEMKAIEQASVEAGVSLDQLMENAGLAVADAITHRLKPIYGKRVVILIGPGNNGGDGFVAARHLAHRGATVRCFLLAKRPETDSKRDLAEEEGALVIGAEENPNEYERTLGTCDVIIDAVLGTGQSRPIGDDLSRWLAKAGNSGRSVHAIDVPTGMHTDSGQFDENGLKASVTYMLGLPKIGPMVRAGDGNSGEIDTLDIGIPEGLDSDARAELVDHRLAKSLLPTRPLDSNKGTFGRALVLAGSPSYVGASILAIRSAARSGAGLVELAARQSVYKLVAASVPDAVYRVLPEASDGQVDVTPAAHDLIAASAAAAALLVGPGLGRDPNTESLVRTLLAYDRNDQPAVLDADCLNILAGTANWWDRTPGPKVLTPHPGEMGRLLGTSARDVQADRLSAARAAADKFGSTVVLKGAATLVASPDGLVRISPWTNPGLAKGGTGDVLAGLLVGLLAQKPDDPADMAALAVYLHGLAGQIAGERSGEVAMTASDVVNSLPSAFTRLAGV